MFLLPQCAVALQGYSAARDWQPVASANDLCGCMAIIPVVERFKLREWPSISAHVFLIFVTSQGKLDEAAPLFERAMDIRVNALGPDDDAVALSFALKPGGAVEVTGESCPSEGCFLEGGRGGLHTSVVAARGFLCSKRFPAATILRLTAAVLRAAR